MMANAVLQEKQEHEMQKIKQNEESSAEAELKEHEQLVSLLSKIPLRAQAKFLSTCDLILTSIDADNTYIVLGSNVGLVFVFCREDKSIRRLKITGAKNLITSVKLHNSVDHFLAVGTSTGYVCIYCFPSKTSALVEKEVHKFVIDDVHKYYITCMEWSTNGMKLYSGDTKGHVVVTEVDFYEGNCKSVVLLIDAGCEIIQLSYNHKVLAVSTIQKNYVVRLDLSCEIVNIELDDADMKGNFGATFVPGLCKTEDALLYSARPGRCLRLFDMNGKMRNMQAFPSPLSPEVPKMYLISGQKNCSTPEDFQFGKMRNFRDNELVTWSGTTVMVLDPSKNKVVAAQTQFDSIIDVAVVDSGEIFVLQRSISARLVRIADKPEKPGLKLSKAVPPPLIVTKEEKVVDKGSKAAVDFIKRSFVNPLKKLDLHLNSVSERNLESKNIPDAIIVDDLELSDKSKPKKEEADSLSQSGIPPDGMAQQTEPSQGASESKDPDDKDGSIVFTRKAKKQRRKQPKNDMQTAVIEENCVENEPEVLSVGDMSTLDILKRADSLLERLSHTNQADMEESQSMRSDDDSSSISNSSVLLAETDSSSTSQPSRLQVSESVKSKDPISIKKPGTISASNLDELIDNSCDDLNLPKPSLSKTTYTFPLDESSAPESMEKVLDALDFIRQGEACEINPMENEKQEDVNNTNYQVVTSEKILAENLETSELSDSQEGNSYSQCFFRAGSICEEDSKLLRPQFVRGDSCDMDYSVESSLDDNIGLSFPGQSVYDRNYDSDSPDETTNAAPKADANVWLKLETPSNIYSTSTSDSHVWYTDNRENIFYHALSDNAGGKWRKAAGKANQIAVSPSGLIVRCLHKKVVLACVKISARHPEGMRWLEHLRDMECISVDNHCAWYITQTGSVMVEPNLSLERPLNRPKKVSCPYKLKLIVSRHSVVWAITDRLQLLVRTGVTAKCVEGEAWELHTRDEPPYMFSHVGIGPNRVGWAVDILGQVWFCASVSRNSPMGCGGWWQVPLSDNMHHDDSSRNLIKQVALHFDPVKFTHIVSSISRAGLITVSTYGIYLALDFQKVFYVCKRNVQGYQWTDAQISPLCPPLGWKLLCVSTCQAPSGLIWAHHGTQGLYAFSRDGSFSGQVEDRDDIVCLSCNESTLWAVTANGCILACDGFDDATSKKFNWQTLSLEQLGNVHFVHISCGLLYLWAVDFDGNIYHRIGAGADRPDQLSPVWLPIDCFSKIVFTKVFAGPEEWMVWAIDNQRLVYTRRGIGETMPIGTEWVHVTGVQAKDAALTKSGVWILSVSGEIYFRQKVRQDKVEGSFWTKIPGLFSRISASVHNELWGITVEGEMQLCSVQHALRTASDNDTGTDRARMLSLNGSIEEDPEWELL